MFESQRRRSDDAVRGVDVTPLIDIVFILLVFLLVTTSFVRDTGIQVERPSAGSATALAPRSLRVSIAASGAVYADGRKLDAGALQHLLARYVAETREPTVIVIPDRQVPAGQVVTVMDAARAAGAATVAIATSRSRE